jgi:hypothetical protein
VTVKAGVMFTGIARFGWPFGTSRAGDGKIGVDWSDSLESSCGGEFNAAK